MNTKIILTKNKHDIEDVLEEEGYKYILSVSNNEIVIEILNPPTDTSNLLQRLKTAKPEYEVIQLKENRDEM